jgi:protein-S-isoprenylcysteine O-methyltransferase Ste14
MDETNLQSYKIAAFKQFVLTSLFLVIQILLFYFSAGQIIIQRSWFYFITAFFHYLASTIIQYKLNPQLVVQRLKRKREGSKKWDEILVRASNLTIIIAVPIIAGLDIGRYSWSNLSVNYAWIGLVFAILSSVLLNYAMISNKYFEPTVRIQKERGHKVISIGPYRIIRHPGYLAGILFAISIPLLFGSLFSFAVVGIYFFLIIVRTLLEDKTLQKELDGYKDYTKEVRYRLFPGIW